LRDPSLRGRMNEDAEVVQEDTLRVVSCSSSCVRHSHPLLRVLAFGLRCSLECLS
jgi:hypothetical protein